MRRDGLAEQGKRLLGMTFRKRDAREKILRGGPLAFVPRREVCLGQHARSRELALAAQRLRLVDPGELARSGDLERERGSPTLDLRVDGDLDGVRRHLDAMADGRSGVFGA